VQTTMSDQAAFIGC